MTINILTDPFEEVHKELAASMGYPDHKYVDLPNMTPPMLKRFMDIVGVDEIVWITQAQRKWPDGEETLRGQILISPAGMQNLRNYTPLPA